MTTSPFRSIPSTSRRRSRARSASAASALAALLALAAALPARAQAPSEYVVQPGDTCASIAKKVLGSEKAYAEIHRLNNMGPPPHHLVPGTRLKIRDDAPDARLTFVKPDVNARKAGAPRWTPANNGAPLYRLDEVNTLRRAGAEVTFRDDTSLQLRENALVVIYGTGTPGVTSVQKSGAVQLVQGELRLRLAQLRGDAVGVDTPAAKIAASSQDLHVGVDEAKMSRVAVYQGKAEVAAQGSKVAVPEGQGTRVAKGKAPEKPRPLPGAPGWTSADTLLKLAVAGGPSPVDLAWKPVARAARYRVEVSQDEKFNGLVVDETVPGDIPVLLLVTPNLEPGRYYARVQAVDADGLPGKPSIVKAVEVARLKVEHGDRHFENGKLEDEREVRFSVESPSALELTVDGKPVTSPVRISEPGRHRVRVSAAGVSEPEEFEAEVNPPPPPPPEPTPAPAPEPTPPPAPAPAPAPAPKVEEPPPPPPAKGVTLGSLMGTPFTQIERPPLPTVLQTGEGLAELRLQPQLDYDQSVRLHAGASYSHGISERTTLGISFQGRTPLGRHATSAVDESSTFALGARFLLSEPGSRLLAGAAVEGIAGQQAARSPADVMLRPSLLVGFRGEQYALSMSHGFALFFTADTFSIESAYQAFYLPQPWLAVGVEAHTLTPLATGGRIAWGGAVGAKMRFGQLELGASARSGLFSPRDQQVWGTLGGFLTVGWHPQR